MGYDLKPREKDIDWFHFNIWGWGQLMRYVGCANAIGLKFSADGRYSYIPDKQGNSPMLNDGFYVSAQQARTMAKIARAWVAEYTHSAAYEMNMDRQWENKVLKFAEWAEKTRGFWVR
jgi:hypothetical protein